VGQFLERRFGITVPAISPWHRAICGDLTSAFDFVTPNETPFPELPWVAGSAARVAANLKNPPPTPPDSPERLSQEPGMRRSRALPYALHVHARAQSDKGKLTLTFSNDGRMGAVFHVYDRLNLEVIPRRYTVEGGKALADDWLIHDDPGRYDLWICGPNGFVREFRGKLRRGSDAALEAEVRYDAGNGALEVMVSNSGTGKGVAEVQANAYRSDGPWPVNVAPGGQVSRRWSVVASHRWYDFTVKSAEFERRFAGRIEDGTPGFSDPAI
jgi:phospholipase C